MLIDNPNVAVDELMTQIKVQTSRLGRSFWAREGSNVHPTGRGSVKMRARATIEENGEGQA